LVEFERVSQMLPHMRWKRARFQYIGQCFMSIAEVAVPEPPGEIASGDVKLPCSMNEKSENRIAVFSDAQLKNRIHQPSVRFVPRTETRRLPTARSLIRRFSGDDAAQADDQIRGRLENPALRDLCTTMPLKFVLRCAAWKKAHRYR